MKYELTTTTKYSKVFSKLSQLRSILIFGSGIKHEYVDALLRDGSVNVKIRGTWITYKLKEIE